jgi:hypothetical protein
VRAQSCIQLEEAPQLDWLVDMTPVDYVCSAVVHLMQAQARSARCAGGPHRGC